jgi:CBS domain-containing protein
MAEIDAGILPVREGDRLVGMITDRAIAIRTVSTGRGPQTPIRDVMNAEVKYCYEDEDLDRVTHNIADIQVRRLQVLNRDKRLVGIISLGDVAATVALATSSICRNDRIPAPIPDHTHLYGYR